MGVLWELRGRTTRLAAYLSIFSFTISLFSAIGKPIDEELCTREVIVQAGNEAWQDFSQVAYPELTADAANVLLDITRQCPSPVICNTEQLTIATENAIQYRSGKSQTLLRRVMRLPRRALVALIWGGAILGPGIISFYATAKMPAELRIPFTNFVMVMSGVLFGRFSGPIEKKLGPLVEQAAFWLWDPSENDGWGQIMKKLNDAARLSNSQVYNQVIVLEGYFKEAAAAVVAGNDTLAARFYVDAILHSTEMFAGLNLEHPVTIRAVRAYLNEFQDISPEFRQQIRRRAATIVDELPNDELEHPSKRGQVKILADRVLRVWLRL
jgi:hypothetical protein